MREVPRMSVGPLIGYGTTIVTGLAGNGSAVATPPRTINAAISLLIADRRAFFARPYDHPVDFPFHQLLDLLVLRIAQQPEVRELAGYMLPAAEHEPAGQARDAGLP